MTRPASSAADPGKRFGLPALKVLGLLLALLFAARVPFGANPDERGHRDYVRLLIQHHGPVAFTPFTDEEKTLMAGAPDPAAPPYDRSETHQPPLYYLLAIPFHLLGGGSVFAARMIAALLQILTIGVTWHALRNLFPSRPELKWGGAAFVALLPLQAQLAGSINNDALTTLLCVLLFWRYGRLALQGEKISCAVWTGVVLGLGLWTKSTVLQTAPALLVAAIFAVRGRKLTAAQAATHVAITLGVALAIASPWLIRNQTLYGDPLALSIYKATGPNFAPADIMRIAHWSTADYARNVGVRSFATFWYLLPPNLPFTQFTGPALPLALVLLLALGGLLGCYRWATRGGEEEAGERRVLGTFVLGGALLVPLYVQFVLTVFQAQGRYFLPALLPAATVTMLGWSELLAARSRTVGIVAVAVVLAGLTAWALWQL